VQQGASLVLLSIIRNLFHLWIGEGVECSFVLKLNYQATFWGLMVRREGERRALSWKCFICVYCMPLHGMCRCSGLLKYGKQIFLYNLCMGQHLFLPLLRSLKWASPHLNMLPSTVKRPVVPMTTAFVGILRRCVGVLICWDQWFCEAARALVLQGAEVCSCVCVSVCV